MWGEDTPQFWVDMPYPPFGRRSTVGSDVPGDSEDLPGTPNSRLYMDGKLVFLTISHVKVWFIIQLQPPMVYFMFQVKLISDHHGLRMIIHIIHVYIYINIVVPMQFRNSYLLK